MTGLVPQNRWDLLPEGRAPSVAVVVTHYEQPAGLAAVLDALQHQTVAPAEVVVTDDGSARTPDVPDGVLLLTQADEGFRAARARNAGAAATSSDVLVFLDADTVPEKGFVAALVRHVAASVDVLAVGRRRHADLFETGKELPEPAWLVDAYARTRDLLDADGLSFRYVISSVMACSRVLFNELGGFDERFIGYGGEDWDFAYRAWNNGAVLAHERDAVAWHDGPDWGLRGETGKDAETLRLAGLIPHPAIRGAPLPHGLPDVLVDVQGDDVRTVHALLRQDHRDLQVRVTRADPLHHGLVREQPWTRDQEQRARVWLELDAPAVLAPSVVGSVVALLTDGGLGEVVLEADGRRVGRARSRRALSRSARHGGDESAFGQTHLQVDLVPRGNDLAGFFAAPW